MSSYVRRRRPSALTDPPGPAPGASSYPRPVQLHGSVEGLLRRGGDDAVAELLAAAVGLLPGYLARLGIAPPADPGAEGRYITRLADPLCHHWLAAAAAAARPGLPPLEVVLRDLGEGHVAGRPVGGDVLAGVCLAEGVCQGDHGARNYFHRHYAGVIAREVSRIGRRAAQELEGLPQDLVCNPRRLATYRGLSGLDAWLRRVVKTSWMDLLKAEERERCQREAWGQAAGGTPPDPDDLPEDGPGGDGWLAAVVRRAVGELPADDVLLIRLIYLDGVRQVEIARRRGVDRSTVSRHAKKAIDGVQRALQGCDVVTIGPGGPATVEAWGVTKPRLIQALAEAVRRGLPGEPPQIPGIFRGSLQQSRRASSLCGGRRSRRPPVEASAVLVSFALPPIEAGALRSRIGEGRKVAGGPAP